MELTFLLYTGIIHILSFSLENKYMYVSIKHLNIEMLSLFTMHQGFDVVIGLYLSYTLYW